MTASPTVVSLFTGAGGLDVGLERAGWSTVAATDLDPTCVRTLTSSQASALPIRAGEARAFLDAARLVEADIAEIAGRDLQPVNSSSSWRPDLLAGGPPCQPWSSAGHQRGMNDPRAQPIEHYFRLVDELQPRFILFENVRGLLTALGPGREPGGALKWIQDGLLSVGYATRVALLNAADFGAPQRRVRLFVVGARDRDVPCFPEPTHHRKPVDSLLSSWRPWVSLESFLDTLPEPRPSDVVRPKGDRAHQLEKLAPGTGIRTPGRVEANRPGGHWGYRQDSFIADPELPARTIRAATTPDWIRDKAGLLRRLTWKECAAIQGFPEGWTFEGTVPARFRQIGNAVQADVAEALGNQLLRALDSPARRKAPDAIPLPSELVRRIRYTEAEHRVNRDHRVRVRART